MRLLQQRRAIQYIPKVLFVIAWILLIYIILIGLLEVDGPNWTYDFSPNGLLGIERFWANHTLVITLFGAVLTLWIASYNLKKYLDVETINALAELRKMLNSSTNKTIHAELLPDDDKTSIISRLPFQKQNCRGDLQVVDLFDYLGTIELGAIMLQREVISKEEFDNQFGYRVDNIANDREIMKHIDDNSKYYQYLQHVICERRR